MSKAARDVEKDYPLPEFVAKLRRLADAIEKGARFDIQIAGERLSVPARAAFSIEHERGEDGEEEIEFQIKWSAKQAAEEAPDTDAEDAERTSGEEAATAGQG